MPYHPHPHINICTSFHLINWLQRFYRIIMSLKRPFVPKSDVKQWFTTTTSPSKAITSPYRHLLKRSQAFYHHLLKKAQTLIITFYSHHKPLYSPSKAITSPYLHLRKQSQGLNFTFYSNHNPLSSISKAITNHYFTFLRDQKTHVFTKALTTPYLHLL